MHWIWSLAAAVTGQRIRTRQPSRPASIYLSFDDGPHPQHTPALLELLARHDAKATFFLIGRAAEAHPDVVRRIVAEGHTIGNHSMTHPKMPQLPAREQLADVARADAVLAPYNGRARQMFRPPNGRATLPLIFDCLRHGQPLVLWSIDSHDYRLDADQVARRLEGLRVAAGDILLFHDDGGAALDALRRLLPRWRENGLACAAL